MIGWLELMMVIYVVWLSCCPRLVGFISSSVRTAEQLILSFYARLVACILYIWCKMLCCNLMHVVWFFSADKFMLVVSVPFAARCVTLSVLILALEIFWPLCSLQINYRCASSSHQLQIYVHSQGLWSFIWSRQDLN